MRQRLCPVLLALCVGALACEKRPPAPSGGHATSPTPAPAPAVADGKPAPAEPPLRPPPLPVAGSIRYVEMILGEAEPDDPLPMIVAIHGLGDAPENFAHVFDTFPERARLILPRGVDEHDAGGWSWFPIRARDRDVDALAGGIKASADKIAEALAVLEKERPTLGRPIVTGFSQGGMLAFAIAVLHGDRTAAAIPVGGWLPPPLWPASKEPERTYPPIVALHGTADNAVPYAATKASVDHLVSIGLPVELKSYDGVPHALTTDVRRDLQDALVDAAAKAAKSGAP